MPKLYNTTREERKREVIDLYMNTGYTKKEIAKMYGLSFPTVRNYITEHHTDNPGIEYQSYTKKLLIAEVKRIIKEKGVRGINYTKLMKDYESSRRCISIIVSQVRGTDKKADVEPSKLLNLPVDQMERILRLYKLGVPQISIADTLHVSQPTVYRYIMIDRYAKDQFKDIKQRTIRDLILIRYFNKHQGVMEIAKDMKVDHNTISVMIQGYVYKMTGKLIESFKYEYIDGFGLEFKL